MVLGDWLGLAGGHYEVMCDGNHSDGVGLCALMSVTEDRMHLLLPMESFFDHFQRFTDD